MNIDWKNSGVKGVGINVLFIQIEQNHSRIYGGND